MIATRNFVFLHLHKSGGTFVNQWLLQFLPDARQLGYHLPRRLIPPPLADLPVIGLVRNPWSYYVSWYAFQAARPQPNPLFRLLSEDGALSFAGTIRNMLNLGADGVHLDALIGALPDTYTNRGLNLPGPQLAAIRGTKMGFYSYLYRYMYEGPRPARVARMEHMRSELPPLLAAAGTAMSDAMATYLATAPATNRSEHSAYPEHYDPGLRDLVAERDGDLIAQHGYRFGD